MDFFTHGQQRATLGVIAGLIGLGMTFCLPKLSPRLTIALILLTSLAVRLAVLPSAASDDVNRYLWEGKLYAQGISPFEQVAEHEIYEPYRDDFWEEMNHKNKMTAYPPLSLHAFAVINWFSYSPMSYKCAFLIVDLFLIALILALLHHYHRPLEWSIIYALSPIPVLAFAAEGHFDVLMVFFLVASVLAYSKKCFVICGAAFGLAVATKIMVIIAAPMILLRTGIKGMTAAALFCLIPFLLHFDDTLQMFNGLIHFGSTNNFNGLFNQFFDDVIGLEPSVANRICGILFVVSWFVSFAFSLRDRLWLSLIFCLGGLILFAPIMHFWYLTWILPFVAIRPSLPWLTLSITTPLYFLVHSHYLSTGFWGLPLWAKWFFYLPFVIISILLLPSAIRSLSNQLRRKVNQPEDTQPLSWSVIIPAMRITNDLSKQISALALQSPAPDEVVVVTPDDSNDQVLESSCFKISTLIAKQGRGHQIKLGVEAASEQWCLVLHAGSELADGTFNKLNHALVKDGGIIGGSLGQRFDRSSIALFFIEFLNDFRASLLKTSFGDQNQFFKRSCVLDNHLLTDQPLMEDVELSDRLYKHGETIHLAYEGEVSAKKWNSTGFWSRFTKITFFYLCYRLLFFSPAKRVTLSKKFYQSYYQQAAAK